jgi:outer membrane receptor protein involved in Fe transport
MKTRLMRSNIMAAAVAMAIGGTGFTLNAFAATAPGHAAATGQDGVAQKNADTAAPSDKTAQAKVTKHKNNPVNLQQVVVTASGSPSSKMNTSISVSSLEPDQIQNSGARNTADILRNIPGVRAEASGGAGNANISVRGLPVATGGGKYVQWQIDGMPVLEFGDIAFATPDTFIRPDRNIERVEVVRGGSSSIFASNAPGAVINFITKTGRYREGGIQLTTGFGYDHKRVDFDYGQPISSTTRFHVGGFWHDGESAKRLGYNAVSGGQLMGNLTHDIDGGYLRASFQYLNDHAPAFLPVPISITGSNSNPSVHSLPGFSVQHGALQSPYFLRDLAVNADGNRMATNIADGYTSKVRAFGGEGLFTLGNDWKLHEQFRIASNSGGFVGQYPAEVNTASALASEIGGAGSTMTYATGPNAGQAVDMSTVGGNGLAQRVHLFNVTLPDMDNMTNNLTLKRKFDTSDGSVDLLMGYYHSNQHIVQDWHWNTYLETVQGHNGALLDVNNGGMAYTDHGLAAYGVPYWGNCCTRSYNVDYTMDAPYLSATWHTGKWRIDGGLRFDRMRASGTYAGSTGTTSMDVNRDGVVEYPETMVPVVNNSAAMPVDYSKNHLEYSIGANYSFSPRLAAFARASSGARFNADRLLFGGGIEADGKAQQGIAVNVVKQYEGGMKWNTSHYSLFATAFYATTQEQNQDVTSTVSTLISRKYKAHGLELEGGMFYGPFSMRAGATYTHSRITSDAITPADVGDVPQRQATWVYQLSPSFNWASFGTGATIIGTTKSYASNPNGLVMPGFTQVNLFANYYMNDHMTLSLHVDNLFNTIGLTEVDMSPVSVTSNGLNTARSILGRTVYASWQYQL